MLKSARIKVLVAVVICAAAGAAQATPITSSKNIDQFKLNDLVCTVVYHTATKTTTMTCIDTDPENQKVSIDPNG